MTAPLRWPVEELQRQATLASGLFRSERLAASDAWDAHYKASHAKFRSLFSKLGDLAPGAITDVSLTESYGAGLGDALRYLAGPPISDDDLKVLADVDSIAPGSLARDSAAARKVFEVIERVFDPHRFPWIGQRRTPTAAEIDAALLASSVLLAAQRIATEWRNDGKDRQETKLRSYLAGLGFTEVDPCRIRTLVDGPAALQFCGECHLGDRKADVVVRLHDTRLMPIECKVSNSSTNSIKRLNNDAAVKAEYWLKQFGAVQVVPAAALAGVYKVLNLEQSQARGLALFWTHDLDRLGEFIASTRPAALKRATKKRPD